MKTFKTASGGTLVMQERPKHFGAERGTYLGGTDIAPILGVSERTTRFAVWAKKIHADLPEDDTNAEERDAGTFYEPYILRRFAQRFDVTVMPSTTTYLRAGALFLGANPDGLVYRGGGAKEFTVLGGVDAKTRSPFLRGAWGEAGTADVPPDEMCQAQWYMEILDLPVWYLAVFFDRQLTVFVVPRDRTLGALMVEEATAFWNDYILPKREPPFEGAAAADYLRQKYPRVTKPLRPAEPEDDILVARKELLERHIAALEARLQTVDGSLKNRIAEAEGVRGNGYTALWNERVGRTTVEWKAVVGELRSFPIVADEENAAAIRKQIDASIDRFRHVGEPSRALKVTFKGPRLLPAVELDSVATIPALPPSIEGETNG
jgi:predicted phage-related endonuclease